MLELQMKQLLNAQLYNMKDAKVAQGKQTIVTKSHVERKESHILPKTLLQINLIMLMLPMLMLL